MNIWLSEEFITLSEECNTNFILRQLQEKYLAEKKIHTLHLQIWRKLFIKFLEMLS